MGIGGLDADQCPTLARPKGEAVGGARPGPPPSSARGGRPNGLRWDKRFAGEGQYAELIGQHFRLARTWLVLNRNDWRPHLSLFTVPPRPGDQLTLL